MRVASVGLVLLVVVAIAAWTAVQARVLVRAKPATPIETTTAWVSWLQLVLAIGATFAAVLGAYLTFFTPFSPNMTVGPYTWRVRPIGSPNASVEIGLWFSVANSGADGGILSDLAARVNLPRGQWNLSPMFVVDSAAYMKSLMNPRDAPELPALEPFSPTYLASNSQVSRALVFIPFAGKADLSYIEPGVFTVEFFARYDNGAFRRVADRKIVIEPDVVSQWRSGITIIGAQFERPTAVEPLLPAKR